MWESIWQFAVDFYWVQLHEEQTTLVMIAYLWWDRRRTDRKHDAELEQTRQYPRCPRCGYSQQ